MKKSCATKRQKAWQKWNFGDHCQTKNSGGLMFGLVMMALFILGILRVNFRKENAARGGAEETMKKSCATKRQKAWQKWNFGDHCQTKNSGGLIYISYYSDENLKDTDTLAVVVAPFTSSLRMDTCKEMETKIRAFVVPFRMLKRGWRK